MGKILKVEKLTTLAEILLLVVGMALIGGGVYWFSPGLRVEVSKKLETLNLSTDHVDNVTKGAMIPVASKSVSTNEKVVKTPKKRIAEYAWDGNSGMIAATGGPNTTKGSLMEAAGVNLEIVRLDGVSDLRDMLVNFTAEYAAGTEYPVGEKTAFGVSVMGDGGPFLIATAQQAINDKFGAGKYHIKNIGAIGSSFGEDKLIGPAKWKENPQSMRGAVICAVIGDGDWVIAVNYASANGIPINPDPTTYDADAVNFVPAPKDDYMEAVKEHIKSQKTGYKITLKVVKNGKLTGESVEKLIEGDVTWTPGDRLAFENLHDVITISSTKDFPNQMATSLLVVDEWAKTHEKEVISILKQSYIAANQIKQYDEWAVAASEAVCKTYNFETPKYWYDLFKSYTFTNVTTGEKNEVGGGRVFTYADALQYFGIGDPTNRYKAVYTQVGKYLTELNPCDFNGTVKTGVIPYDDAVDLYFLKSITDIDAGTVAKQDYSATKTEVLATGNWSINFETGSNLILQTEKNKATLQSIYNLLIQAEQTKLDIVGHTDNVGKKASNVTLSRNRADAVVAALEEMGIKHNRFQLVDGKGDFEPIGDNKTNDGRGKNRRVVITMLK